MTEMQKSATVPGIAVEPATIGFRPVLLAIAATALVLTLAIGAAMLIGGQARLAPASAGEVTDGWLPGVTAASEAARAAAAGRTVDGWSVRILAAPGTGTTDGWASRYLVADE